MSQAIIGIQSCGCVTYANSRPDHLDASDRAAIVAILASGGSVVRTTVRGARQRKHFLPAECPHEPKGW